MERAVSVVYLCGPINGCSDKQAHGWRQSVMAKLSGTHTFLDPMRRDYREHEAGHEREIVEAYLADIQNSDIVLALCGRPSWGTAMEIFAADRLYRKPCIVIGGSGSPWLEVHATARVATVRDAVELLRKWDE